LSLKLKNPLKKRLLKLKKLQQKARARGKRQAETGQAGEEATKRYQTTNAEGAKTAALLFAETALATGNSKPAMLIAIIAKKLVVVLR